MSLLTRASKAAYDYFRGPGAGNISAVASRIGVSGSVSATKIAEFVKQNKLTAAFVLYEMGSAGATLLAELAGDDSDVARMIDVLDIKSDPISDSSNVLDSEKYEDQLRVLSRAARSVGSFERLMELKAAVEEDWEMYRYYMKVRSSGKGLV